MKYHVVGGGLNVREELPGMAIQYQDEQPEDFRTWLALYPRNVGSKFGWGSSAFLEFVEVLIQHELWTVLEFKSMYAYIEHMIPDAWDHIAEVDQVREQLKPIKAEATKGAAQGKRTDTLPNNIRKLEQGTSQEYALRRLAREHVKLFEQVKSGELSANAAAIKAGFRSKTISPGKASCWLFLSIAIKAGFRSKTISIPVDKPEAAAKAIVRHVKDLDALLTAIATATEPAASQAVQS